MKDRTRILRQVAPFIALTVLAVFVTLENTHSIGNTQFHRILSTVR